MAPTFYHYTPVPMEKTWEEQGPGIRRRWLVAAVLMFLISVVLAIPLIYFAVRTNSEACRDGLRVWDECRNTTHFLQRQLTRAQENLLQAETQANTCNLTVVTLQDSLEKKESQVLEQQAHIQELESKIMKLNQELETLRTKEEASSTAQNSASSVVVSSLLTFVVPMFLLF
ncbi:bone marrow stromal antigen 2 [Chionomys nivalis]|uniref:bone marrow stromal antigen 2 n=1 Tax=Chionomys nivalis TaxID=269649 RepID=UPI0025986E8E|nr:bone marrow stromal antigen 2 [Chionomys nivalis]XP_057608725.1 bone marrow stromal antigen 2 [Chionomys nivalis]